MRFWRLGSLMESGRIIRKAGVDVCERGFRFNRSLRFNIFDVPSRGPLSASVRLEFG